MKRREKTVPTVGPSSRWHAAARPRFAGLGALTIAVAALVAQSTRAEQRCSEDVCLELTLPPHVSMVRPGSTLECVLILPAAAPVASTFKIILQRVTEPRKCYCEYEMLRKGSTWKRALFELTKVDTPGTYSIGVAPASAAHPAQCLCSPKDEAKFLARKIQIGR